MSEPCSALDPIASAVVEELIQRLRNRYTVVIVTHNLAQARRVANYAAFFWMTERVGKLIEFGRCQSLFDSPSSLSDLKEIGCKSAWPVQILQVRQAASHDLTAAYVTGVSG